MLLYAKLYWLDNIFSSGYAEQVHIARIDWERDNAWALDVVQFIDLYNDHYFLFFMCGLLLFVAMMGSIVITYPFFKYQK